MIPIKDENPTQSIPFFTLLLIAVNVSVFIYQMSLGRGMEAFMLEMAAIPYEITHMKDTQIPAAVPLPLTLFTSLFLHGNLAHLGGNMLYLWIFGNNIEDALGHLRFLLFYLLCGFIATMAHIMSNPDSPVPLVGASGAIAGILGAYLLLYPKAKVQTLVILIFFIRIIRLPAAVLLTLWFILQVVNSTGGGNIAWYAHIGGFAAGFLLVKPFLKKKRGK